MSKNIKSKYKISRRIGVPIWGTKKDSCNKRSYPPGMHGPMLRRKNTEYGMQLLEKQKLKKYYGNIREKQFKKIYKIAYKKKGNTGLILIRLLESRLDTFVFRSGIAPTIFSAKQYINHKHIIVNNSCINIPSYILKPGDIVEVEKKSKKLLIFKDKNFSTEGSNYINI